MVIAHVSSYWSTAADKGLNGKQRLNKPKLLRKDSKQEDRQHTQDVRMSNDWASCDLFDSSLCPSQLCQEKKKKWIRSQGFRVHRWAKVTVCLCALPGEFVAFSPPAGLFRWFRLKGIERSHWELKNSHLLKRNDEGENREVTRTCGKEEKSRPQLSPVLWLTDRLHPRATLSG